MNQGHIALDQARFPEKTPGFVLDVLARSSLWKIGLDYRHGTGHGVGAALNVHEGPQSISYRYENMTGLQGGMIVSDEPGYYEDRSFGIRIENLLVVREVKTPNRFGGITYLGFEKLTFVPIQSKLVDLSLVSAAEIEWLRNYHSEVWEKVSPLVGGALELALLTGSCAHERYTGPQIRKLNQRQKDVYDNTERISLVSSYDRLQVLEGEKTVFAYPWQCYRSALRIGGARCALGSALRIGLARPVLNYIGATH